MLSAIRETGGIKAMAHITGGGFIDNIPRVLPDTFAAHVDLSTFSPPAVFGWLSRTGGVAQGEMLRTFNCGIGMVVVVDPAAVNSVIAVLGRQGETAFRLGVIENTGGEKVRFSGRLGF
jgi:phosphoribosylformylglycinamidine cyclo-ligase